LRRFERNYDGSALTIAVRARRAVTALRIGCRRAQAHKDLRIESVALEASEPLDLG